MNPNRRITSSTEVGRKVLGSANPFAKGFRKAKGGCADSIGGIFFGIILFMLAFWPAWCSVRGVDAVSKDVDALPLMTAAEAEGQSGMVKVQDDVEDIDAIELDIECGDMYDEVDVLWYTYSLQEYTEHYETQTRTETKDEDGQEVEYTYEDEVLVEDWEVKEENTEVVDSFFLGNIEVRPAQAEIRLEGTEECEDKGREEIGEEWLAIEYMPVEDVGRLVVVGEIDNDEIRGGDPFIVTDRSPDDLVAAMAGEESTSRWMLTIVAIIMFFISFNLIIGPLLFLLNYVPVIGSGLRFGIGIGSLILAIIWVMLLKFIIAFWWLIFIIVIAVVVLLVMAGKKKGAGMPEVEGDEAVLESGAEGTIKCPKCGELNEADAKFCSNCGETIT